MKRELAEQYAKLKRFYAEFRGVVKSMEDELRKCVDKEELADTAYAMREAIDLTDEFAKVAKQTKHLAEKMACLLWMQGDSDQPIRTKYVTATPDLAQKMGLPTRRKNPEEFKAMMQFLEVPEHLWNVDDKKSTVIEPHWPGMMEHIKELMEQGKPLPPGIDPHKTYPDYKLRLTRRNAVDHEIEDDSDEHF